MSNVYLFCCAFGFLFTVVGAVLSGVFGGGDTGADGGVDAGGDFDASVDGGIEVGGADGPDFAHTFDAGGDSVGVGEGEVAGEAGGSVHLPIFSPMVIAFFLFTFGGTGLILHRVLGIQNPWIHAPASSANGILLGLALAFGIYKLTSVLESNRMARASDALSSPAEVTVTVPREGVGEIAYVSGGTRQTLSARSMDGREHKQGTAVRVFRIADGVAQVGVTTARPALVTRLEGQEPALGEPARGEPVHTRK